MRVVRVALMLTLAAACAGPAAGPTPEPRTVTVLIDRSEFGYVPASLEIAAGTRVLWQNTDKNLHTVTYSETAQPGRTADGSFKVTDLLFNFTLPGTMEAPGGTSASYVFATPGTYHYFCLPHDASMRGVVVVK